MLADYLYIVARLHYHLAQKLFQTLHGPNQTFPNLPPEYERQGGDTYHLTCKYLLPTPGNHGRVAAVTTVTTQHDTTRHGRCVESLLIS